MEANFKNRITYYQERVSELESENDKLKKELLELTQETVCFISMTNMMSHYFPLLTYSFSFFLKSSFSILIYLY